MLEILKEQNNAEINDEMELIYENRLNMVNEIAKSKIIFEDYKSI